MSNLRLQLLVILFLALVNRAGADGIPDAYVQTIRESGSNPVAFVANAMKTHDLIIFDDALHSAQEPFDFYQQLLRNPEIQQNAPSVFLEVISLTAQPSLDAYLGAKTADPALLAKVFQDDYSGYGWHYQTYMDLLETIRQVNSTLPESKKIKVIGVDQPIYWEAIHTRQDYDIFQDSLVARDYFLFSVIAERMDNFKSGRKGFFLTNTRHSYKHLKKANGQLHWNCATFFDQLYPGKTYSVRLHNVALFVEAALPTQGGRSTEGMEEVKYSWIRMEDGRWDRAFREAGNHPVAIPLRDNVFGRAKYVGNQMLDVAADQTMADVHDALIFLGPLEKLHTSGKFGFIYTESFRAELKRRINILEGGRMDAFLKENGAATVDAFIDALAEPQPMQLNALVAALPPIRED